MKIRKILPLVLLALITLVTLSSCDWLLDAIFKGSSTLNIWVDVSEGTHPQALSVPVTVTLWNGTGAFVGQEMNYFSSSGGGLASFYFSFDKLNSGTYTFTAYYPGSALPFDPNAQTTNVVNIPSDGMTVTVTAAPTL